MVRLVKKIVNRLRCYRYNIQEKKECRYMQKQIKRKGGAVEENVKFAIYGTFNVGEDVVLNSTGIDLPEVCKITVCKDAELTIGDHTGISQTSIWCKSRITIGNHVDIGAGCLIFDSNFHSLDWNERLDRIEGVSKAINKPVTIGDNCFIGCRCIICKGVHIGPRSIIAAGSVVTKSIPADCIAGGNPCKVIRYNKVN